MKEFEKKKDSVVAQGLPSSRSQQRRPVEPLCNPSCLFLQPLALLSLSMELTNTTRPSKHSLPRPFTWITYSLHFFQYYLSPG